MFLEFINEYIYFELKIIFTESEEKNIEIVYKVYFDLIIGYVATIKFLMLGYVAICIQMLENVFIL